MSPRNFAHANDQNTQAGQRCHTRHGHSPAASPSDGPASGKPDLYAPLCSLELGQALAQKISALALREQVQSRDVFDLKLLLDAGGAEQPLPATAAANLAAAIDNALAVDYDAFAGQDLAFREPEYQEHYGTRKVWAKLQGQVVDGLEALGR